MKIISTLLLAASLNLAHAEYRVYQYVIKNKVESSKNSEGVIIQSTLDPTSYLAYNGGSQFVSIDLLRTWICPGNTGQGKDTCPSPYKKLTAEMIK
jgi:hypothetical protein